MGSLVCSMALWMLLALEMSSLVLSSPEVEPRALRLGPDSVADEGDVGDDDLSLARFQTQKRSWGQQSTADLSGEDKRRWGQKNMALWGKRFYDDDGVVEYPATKRRWGQKHMGMWGKRSVGDMLRLDADLLEAQKRKWGQKSMALWG